VQAFVSRRIATREGIRPGVILVRDGIIRDLVRENEVPPGIPVHDFGESVILPGLVDSHVHINDPGRTDWEGFETATKAAAAGGYTMLVDMPLNCVPATTTAAALMAKQSAAQGRTWVDWGCWGGLVGNDQTEIEQLAKNGVLGFKCFLIHPGIEEFSLITESDLRAALPRVSRTGLPLLVHAELPGPIDEATKKLDGGDWSRYSTYQQSRPEQAELSAIRLMLSLCRWYQFHVHIVHLATAEAIPELCAVRAEGLPVTVETCPHYLHFSAEEIPDGATLFKCAPPIRSRVNRERLWQGLKEGAIDLVVTDHSPCPPAMKRQEERDFRTAWGGIAGLSVALPVIWSEASRRGFTLLDVIRWMSEAPARLAGCSHRKGRIAEGYDADFVIFEPEQEFTVSADRLYYRHPISPYLGEKLKGVVKATYLRGEAVFEGGSFAGNARGRNFTAERRGSNRAD
jgi:allantoinase